MTVQVNDTVWFTSPDGGEIKLSFGGYREEEAKRLIGSLTRNGWELVEHKRTTKNVHWWTLGPEGRRNLFWFALGSLVQYFLIILLPPW